VSKVLEIEDLSFFYEPKKPIFNSFSLSLNKGEAVAIVGPSGSGKSTLFELISGNLKPKSGLIKHQKLSFVFQDPYSSFSPTYSIKNQIKDCAKIDNINSLATKLNLDLTLLDKKPFELSGGQLQRCSILRAILMKPKLLLVDEPTSALDNVSALEVMKLLVSFLDELGILIITHDIALARWSADRIVDITRG